MILSHFTAQPFTLDRSRTYEQGKTEVRASAKPRGLWLSDESDHGWSVWCKDEGFRLHTLLHRTDFAIVEGANVRMLTTNAEILEFQGEFGVSSRWFEEDKVIKWDLVAELYDGIVITPYSFSARWNVSWYSGWDCASGCFWNLSAVEQVPA